MKNSNIIIRSIVPKQGYGLDILINDPEWYVRMEVAKQGYALDILINDPIINDRCEVANRWMNIHLN